MKTPAFALLLAAAGIGPGASSASAANDRQTGVVPAQVRITNGPELERATDNWAIIRWTTSDVKGTSLRYGVVRYGIDPHRLNQTAKSPNRWNGGLAYMIYRVQVNHLQPATTYYYRVESENALEVSEGPESTIGRFTTDRAP